MRLCSQCLQLTSACCTPRCPPASPLLSAGHHPAISGAGTSYFDPAQAPSSAGEFRSQLRACMGAQIRPRHPFIPCTVPPGSPTCEHSALGSQLMRTAHDHSATTRAPLASTHACCRRLGSPCPAGETIRACSLAQWPRPHHELPGGEG